MIDRRALILGAILVLALAACTKQGEPFMPTRPGQIDSTKVEGVEYGRWTRNNNPYYVLKSVVVPANRTLTLEPGVLVIFTKQGLNLTVRGTLLVEGKPDSLVNFRPNANRGLPAAPGDFGSLVFERGSVGRFSATRILYGTTAIRATDADLVLNDCTLSNNRLDGLSLVRTNLSMTNCTIANNGANGITLNECDSPIHPVTIDHCNIGNNHYSGIWSFNSAFVARRSDIRNNGDNRVPDFSAGIHFEGLPGIDPPMLRHCNLNQNLPCDLRNLMPPGIVVEADSNYWGSSSTDEMTLESNPTAPPPPPLPPPRKDNCLFNVRQICDGLDYPSGGGIAGVRFCNWLDRPAPNFSSSSQAIIGGYRDSSADTKF